MEHVGQLRSESVLYPMIFGTTIFCPSTVRQNKHEKEAPMKTDDTTRMDREITHGKLLASEGAEGVWGWETPAGRRRAQRRADLIVQGAHLGPGKKALEIGCGTGNFTEIFANTGANVTAVDLSPELLEIARKRGLPEDRVSFLEQPFETCEVHGPFDAIIGSSVLHHLEVEVALRKIYELLKPGGILSFAEPNILNPQVYMERRFSHWKRFYYTSPDETAFVRWKLDTLLKEIGYVNRRITPYDWLHPSTPQTMIPLIDGLGRVVEKIPGLREFSGSHYIRAERPADSQD